MAYALIGEVARSMHHDLMQNYKDYWFERDPNYREALKQEFTVPKLWFSSKRGHGREKVYETLFKDLFECDQLQIRLKRELRLNDILADPIFGFDLSMGSSTVAAPAAAAASAPAASASASGGPLSRPPGRSLPPAPGVGAPAPTSVVAASAASAPAPALSDDDDSDDAPVVPSQFAQDIAAAAARRKGAGVSAAPAAAAPALVSRKAAAPALFATKAANPWYEDSSDDDSSDDEDEDKRRRIFREKVMEKMENVSSAASAPSASAASASAASTSAASIPASLLQMPSVVGVKNPLLLTEEVKPSQLKCPGVNSWFFETELPEGIMCKNCYKMKKYHIPFTSGGPKSSRRCRRRHRSRRRSHHRSNKKSRKVHRVRKVRKSHRHVRS